MQASVENGKIKVEFDLGKVDKDLLSFLSLLETTNKSKATEKDIWQLSEEIKTSWWNENKEKFLNENCS